MKTKKCCVIVRYPHFTIMVEMFHIRCKFRIFIPSRTKLQTCKKVTMGWFSLCLSLMLDLVIHIEMMVCVRVSERERDIMLFFLFFFLWWHFAYPLFQMNRTNPIVVHTSAIASVPLFKLSSCHRDSGPSFLHTHRFTSFHPVYHYHYDESSTCQQHLEMTLFIMTSLLQIQ